jgi:hypothetical protein
MQKVSIKLSSVTIQTNGPRWEPAEWLNGKYISEGVSETGLANCSDGLRARLLASPRRKPVSTRSPRATLNWRALPGLRSQS